MLNIFFLHYLISNISHDWKYVPIPRECLRLYFYRVPYKKKRKKCVHQESSGNFLFQFVSVCVIKSFEKKKLKKNSLQLQKYLKMMKSVSWLNLYVVLLLQKEKNRNVSARKATPKWFKEIKFYLFIWHRYINQRKNDLLSSLAFIQIQFYIFQSTFIRLKRISILQWANDKEY